MSTFVVFLPLIILAVCFIFRIPIGIGMICSAVIYLLTKGHDLGAVTDTIMGSINANTVIVAIPLFLFTANIMNSGKVTERMFTFVKALIGRKRGAMAYINIIVSLIFSGMSGSAIADASGIGVIELEEMKKDGYDTPFSCAITSATSVVGPIFPPSIPMVVYAMLAETSVGKLFMGGMVPATLICLALGIYVWYISKKRNYPKGESFTFKKFIKYTLKALPALLTPVILLGGIYSGIVTPTEAGALAAFYTIIISVLAYKVLNFRGFLNAVKDTVIQTGFIMAIIAGAYALSYVVTFSGMGNIITNWFLSITTNKYIFLLIFNIVFLFLGMIMDSSILTFVFVPLVLPVVTALGIDLVHFGVVFVVNMMIGMATPPYGLLCFITSGLAGESLKNVYREIIPMVLVQIGILLLITYFPVVVMGLPSLSM